ncbi:MAG TPA: MarR family transcriptional regulator [Candidatus Krumholzibacteriaceae bacterium]|jgi:predicted transcriptional regulator|nr:MarR family transcriptional regulator [Candidatus Krumholzibacteriaceae bacterium]
MKGMIDLFLVGVVALLLISLGAFLFYYRRIRKLTEEYEGAKTLVNDIIASFNKQFRNQEDKLSVITQKIISFASKSDKVDNKAMKQEEQIKQISAKITELSGLTQLPEQVTSVTQKITDVTKSQEELRERMTNLETKLAAPEINIESVIPIKQDKALASLTPTELSVLETLANEGEKTAPEIKTRVNLTREHTARLMKKLYEEGYLERTTGKIPFAYRIKEEMSKILKKPEAKA